MLPLDKLSAGAQGVLTAHGVNLDNVDMCLRLDLDLNGDYSEMWLAHSKADGVILRFTVGKPDADGAMFDSFPLDLLTEPYIDNYATSNRLQAHLHDAEDKKPAQGTETDDEYRETIRKWAMGGTTIVLGYCTNTCKLKLLAFTSLWDRLGRDEEVKADDQIFEQFNRVCPKCGRPYRDMRSKICETCVNKKGVMARLLTYFKFFRPQLITILICLLATTAISILTPIVSGQILYDRVIDPRGDMHELRYVYVWVGVLIGMAVLSLVIGVIQNRANAYLSTRVSRNMKNDVFRAMQRLSLSYFNQNPTGRLINRVNYDAERVRGFFIDGVPYFIMHALSYIVLSVVLFTINWKLTLMLFAPIPFIVLMVKFAIPKLWRAYSSQWRRSSSMNAMMNDSLTGIRVVKAFAKESEETNRFYDYSSKLYRANLKVNEISLFIFPVIGLMISGICNAMWGPGGIMVIDGRMTYGELTTYIGYTGLIFGPISFFTNFTNQVTDVMNCAVRMFEIMDMTPEVVEAKEPVHMDKLSGEIVFDHVCFHYNPNRPILKDINFTIREGDHVGLVGHTGSGKSTIANLITRMYDVVSGSITIDGVDIKQLETATLRKNVAIVSQEVYIFQGTIADNIRYARPDATMDEVVAAAKAANAHDFILALPEGYESKVGIGSRSLSGGERQRISIARALLLDPSLLILDEATAAMDTETERLISEAIDRVSAGKTTISIAHRLSTLKNCDYLMAIDNGELSEMGTAEELMEKKGIYYRLWTLQNEQLMKVMKGE